MSNPWLNLAIGGLKGAEANRQRRTDEEERKRKHEKEDLELRLGLAELAASNPDEFELSGFPFVDAATAGAASGPPGAGAPAAGLPETPAAPGRARRWRPDTGWQEAPTGKPAEAVNIGPGPHPQGTPPPKPPVPAVVGGPSTPFLDRAIELGKVNIGGQDVSIIQHPGRTKAHRDAKNRAAYEALHEADSEAYPAFIESADYAKEMAEYASGVRAGRIENKRAIRTGSAAAASAAARVRRDLAEDIAYDLFEQGGSLEEVQAAIAKDPQARGGLSAARARSIQRDAARAAPDTERTRQRISTQLGKPVGVRTGEAPIDPETQEKVIEALARGHSAEEILAGIGDPALKKGIERWLKRGAQLRRPTATTGQP